MTHTYELVLNEWSQIYVPRRVASPGDVVANTVGVALGLLLALSARRFGTLGGRRPGIRAAGSTGE